MPLVPPWWAGYYLAVALVAIGVGVYQTKLVTPNKNNKNKKQSPSPTTSKNVDEPVTYVIGDLHGDYECGKYWVDRLGLVDADYQKWLQPAASLVFMGDYVDKGPYSYQTIQLVKSLTDQFPTKVTALMGNHELELLKDRHDETKIKYMQLAYSSVHPAEYLNFVSPHREIDDTDHVVIDLLLNASLEVYGRRWHQSILVAPELDHAVQQTGRRGIVDLFFDDPWKPVVRERLREYQTTYLNAFRSNTTLGQWMERLSVAHVENGVLFTHGGISESIVQQILSVGGVDALNELVWQHSNDESFLPFLQTTAAGRAVYEMLIHRGNHQAGACLELPKLLQQLPENVERLAVGHTPGKNVRSNCAGTFWAVDSLLGRWIRTSGNMYCAPTRRVSQNGKYICDDLTATCQGQVIKVSSSAGVEVIW